MLLQLHPHLLEQLLSLEAATWSLAFKSPRFYLYFPYVSILVKILFILPSFVFINKHSPTKRRFLTVF